jgi:hypothetical protein
MVKAGWIILVRAGALQCVGMIPNVMLAKLVTIQQITRVVTEGEFRLKGRIYF